MIRPEDLVYFCLNEGDGDTQLLLLPQAEPGPRQGVVVDVVQAAKLDALINAIQGRDSDQPVDRPLLADPVELPLVVATHPHDDHIRGMASFLRSHAAGIGMFWEPGYRASTQAYMTMMGELADRAGSVQHVQPTSGTTVWLSQTRITALSPAIGLRNHFDTYGVDLNDASIGLRIEFPTSSAIERDGVLFYNPPPSRAALVLGADSQARSWSEILVDFPRLEASRSPIAKALREATGADHLAATVFKVSHHCSNRGSYLELIEKIAPKVCLVTADPYRSQHHFPHRVALEAIREARQSTAKGGER
jgi:beta-lactamase superfamily II metal-dependent hydrolase